jgi:hypothetical protein
MGSWVLINAGWYNSPDTTNNRMELKAAIEALRIVVGPILLPWPIQKQRQHSRVADELLAAGQDIGAAGRVVTHGAAELGRTI